MRSSLALALAPALGLSACATCGTFSYKGYTVEERCGVVYGVQGTFFEEDEAVELEITSTTRVDDRHIDWNSAQPTIRVRIHAEDIEKGTLLTEADVDATCIWGEFGPGQASSIGETREGTFEHFEVEVLGKTGHVELDPEGPRRRFRWDVACGDGVLAAEGTDVVLLRSLSTRGFP